MQKELNSSDSTWQPAPIAAKYTTLVERSPLPLALIEHSTHVLWDANAAFCQLLGTTPALLIGQSFLEVLPVGHGDQVRALLNQVVRTEAASPALDIHEQNQAEPKPISWAYTVWPIPDGPNGLAGLVVLVMDTAQFRYEQTLVDARAINEQLLLAGLREQVLVEQLEHQLAFTTAITGSMGEGIYALDRAGRITYMNRAAEQILGWSVGDLFGSRSDMTIHHQATSVAPTMAEGSPLRTVLEGGKAYWDENAEWVRRDGTTFPAAYSVSAIVINEQINGAVVVFRDITDVRRLQQAQDEYLALISHDLRQPLTVIIGRAEVLWRTLVKQGLEREAAFAQIVIDHSIRMNRMIEDLLERSLLEAGAEMLRLAPFDLAQLCTRIVEQTESLSERVRVELDFGTSLVVNGDAARIERVVVNMLTNAQKFSTSASLVTVRVYRDGNNAVVSVADQGRGIDPEDLPHLFEKHYRAYTVRQVAGTGLGLYISRLLMEAHGGRIWAESEVNVGSTFRFSLPITF